jgi:hypothetical protein
LYIVKIHSLLQFWQNEPKNCPAISETRIKTGN